MALSKVFVCLVAIMLVMTPSTSAIRGFDVGRRALTSISGVLSKSQMELGDLSLEDQQEAMRMDMDAAKRRMLSYDPYYNKWYGGGHGGSPGGGHGGYGGGYGGGHS